MIAPSAATSSTEQRPYSDEVTSSQHTTALSSANGATDGYFVDERTDVTAPMASAVAPCSVSAAQRR